MSAWVVTPAHIDVLVKGMIEKKVIAAEDADECGRDLYAECVKSVSYRYPDDSFDELPGLIEKIPVAEYRYVEPSDKLVLTDQHYRAAARCYRYQSCEHPGWESSAAHDSNEHLIARSGGERDGSDVVYGEVVDGVKQPDPIPWGFDDDLVHPDGRKQVAA